MADRLPPHVIRDLGTKLANDIDAATRRTVLLVDHPSDQYALGCYGLAQLCGAVSGMYMAAQGIPTVVAKTIDPLDVAITMLLGLKDAAARKAKEG